MLDALAIGILASVGSALAFGSFAVPIKCRSILAAKVDPFCYQVYKSFTCCITSFLILSYTPFKFTYWGIVGGLIWVVNGVCAIMSVQRVGVSIAQGTWSALSIFVAFIWGAFIFHEDIKSLALSFVGLILMAIGMSGLGYAAHRVIVASAAKAAKEALLQTAQAEVVVGGGEEGAGRRKLSREEEASFGRAMSTETTDSEVPIIHKDVEVQGAGAAAAPPTPVAESAKRSELRAQVIGLALAVYIGVANGSFTVPFKYAQKDVKGIVYVVSFGIGAAMVTVVAGAVYATTCLLLRRPVPSMQCRVAAGPAILTGLLWSLGNYLSIYAVEYLGLSLGWPLVQCQLIISSLWGILYYHEIEGWITIVLFSISTAVILVGVFVLASYGV